MSCGDLKRCRITCLMMWFQIWHWQSNNSPENITYLLSGFSIEVAAAKSGEWCFVIKYVCACLGVWSRYCMDRASVKPPFKGIAFVLKSLTGVRRLKENSLEVSLDQTQLTLMTVWVNVGDRLQLRRLNQDLPNSVGIQQSYSLNSVSFVFFLRFMGPQLPCLTHTVWTGTFYLKMQV